VLTREEFRRMLDAATNRALDAWVWQRGKAVVMIQPRRYDLKLGPEIRKDGPSASL
jgi:hypothetical protein